MRANKSRRVLRNQIPLTLKAIMFMVSFLMYACIEEFEPDISSSDQLLVISGSIIKEDSVQIVQISKSTSLSDSEFNALSGCTVSVSDDLGNVFDYVESSNSGEYHGIVLDQYLNYNTEFQLHVITPDKNEYQSDWDPMLESSSVDSIYYDIESKQTSSEEIEQGIQFYVDLKAPEDATQNYRWKVEETWEIHTSYSIDGYWDRYDTKLPDYEPISGDLGVCWSTELSSDLYSSSTQNLSVNEKKKIPLGFVSSNSSRLSVKYSLLVKQYALSDAAYQFVNQNSVASGVTGGLYQSQASQTISNIHNINDPDEEILGFFMASSYTEKRIFVEEQQAFSDLDCSDLIECIPSEGQSLLGFFMALQKSVYLVALEFNLPSDSIQADYSYVALWGYPYSQLCIDCTAEGGTTSKPIFWE